MEEVAFKDYIKRLYKLPLLYRETHKEPQLPIPHISICTTSTTITERNVNSDDWVTVKILNGAVVRVPRTGKVGELKRSLRVSGPVRIIHQGKALDDEFALSGLPTGTVLQAVVSTTTAATSINRTALSRDLTALLLRHGVPPVQVDSLVTSFISQFP